MRVLLQHTLTDCYFQTLDRWTSLQTEGLDFGSFEKAVCYAHAHQLANVQIALWCVPNGQRFLLSIPDPEQAQASADAPRLCEGADHNGMPTYFGNCHLPGLQAWLSSHRPRQGLSVDVPCDSPQCQQEFHIILSKGDVVSGERLKRGEPGRFSQQEFSRLRWQ